MRTTVWTYIALIGIIAISAVSFFWDTPVVFMEHYIGDHRALGAILFCILMIAATVVAPVAVLPMVPIISPVLGPFTTGLISVIGWTIGAVIAFLIARYAGRPILERFVSLETIQKYESLMPRETRFFSIVLLRMLVPVDILSYAIGFFSTVGLLEYTLATLIGVSYFSFAFAYLGQAAIEQNMALFLFIGVGSLVVFLSVWLIFRLLTRSK